VERALDYEPETRMPALLDARSLVKHLGGRRVVDGVDLACETS